MFYCEFYKIFKNTFFTEHMRTAAFIFSILIWGIFSWYDFSESFPNDLEKVLSRAKRMFLIEFSSSDV